MGTLLLGNHLDHPWPSWGTALFFWGNRYPRKKWCWNEKIGSTMFYRWRLKSPPMWQNFVSISSSNRIWCTYLGTSQIMEVEFPLIYILHHIKITDKDCHKPKYFLYPANQTWLAGKSFIELNDFPIEMSILNWFPSQSIDDTSQISHCIVGDIFLFHFFSPWNPGGPAAVAAKASAVAGGSQNS